MKRLIVSSILLTLSVAFAISAYLSVCSKIDKLTAVMKIDRELTVSSGESDSARIENIEKEWGKHEIFLVSILAHDEIEEIEIGIMCLKDYNKQNLTEEYIKTLNECINRLEHIKSTEKPNTKNIF